MDDSTRKKYELLALFSPDLTEKERDEALKVVADVLKIKKGKIEEEKSWGIRDLAYSIKKKNRGYYHIWHFWQDGSNISEIDRDLTLDNSVLRHMITAIKDDEKITIFLEEEPKKSKKREKRDESELSERTAVSSRRSSHDKVSDTKEEVAEDKPKRKQAKPSEKELQMAEEKLNKIIDGSDISL